MSLGAWSWLVVSFREFLKILGSGTQMEEIGHWETGNRSLTVSCPWSFPLSFSLLPLLPEVKILLHHTLPPL